MSSIVSKVLMMLSVSMISLLISMTLVGGQTAGISTQDNDTVEDDQEDRADGETILLVAFLVAIIGMFVIIYIIISTDKKK